MTVARTTQPIIVQDSRRSSGACSVRRGQELAKAKVRNTYCESSETKRTLSCSKFSHCTTDSSYNLIFHPLAKSLNFGEIQCGAMPTGRPIAGLLLLALLLGVGAPPAESKSVALRNDRIPLDQHGDPLRTGEGDVLHYGGLYYLYLNDWGGCAGVDCCSSPFGCLSCCFKRTDACVYANNHTVNVYSSPDLSSWTFEGPVLTPSQVEYNGAVFRPHVVYNAATGKFVMWFLRKGRGYSVALAASPTGPFDIVNFDVPMATKDKKGDFDIFVDDDGQAYHVRYGFSIERLNGDYTGVTGEWTRFSTPEISEGPVMFKRRGIYYIMPGTICCACRGGSSSYVLTSTSPMGEFVYRGEVTGNSTAEFDPHSPYNWNTRAQASAVFLVPSSSGEMQYVWMGNQWVSSPDSQRNHDLLYWAVLHFDEETGMVMRMEREEECWVDVATGSEETTMTMPHASLER